MEKEFTEWFKANEKRFAHGQFDEKQIAYSAWLEGQERALRIHDVVRRSEQLTCPRCKSTNILNPDKDNDAQCIECAFIWAG